MKRPTLRDVAKTANVSVATVSMVVNNQTGGRIPISAETRQRVMQAVNELGYVPNLMARGLRTEKTHLLAIMVQDLVNPFFPLLIRGAQYLAEESGFEIFVFDCIETNIREATFINSILQRQLDGVIMVSYQSSADVVQPLLRNHIPVVTIGPQWPGIDSVNVDDRFWVSEMVKYLVGRGHTRIAHLAGLEESPSGFNRRAGYLDGLTESGIAIDDRLIIPGTYHRAGVAEQLTPVFCDRSVSPLPTALVVANDIVALEAIQVLKRWGYRVPDDVAVTGYDNIIEGQYASPALTTVANDPEAMGRKCIELLLGRLAETEPAPAQHLYLPGKLVVRESA